jgi:phosphoribosylanthranilate isomerase
MVRVKICGIRDIETAEQAVAAGADYIGLNFVPSSKRYITMAEAEPIVRKVRGRVQIVGVFQDAPLETVNAVSQQLGLDYVQLHGAENPEYVHGVTAKVIKAIPLPADADIATIAAAMHSFNCPLFLLDRAQQGQGATIDLSKAGILAAQFPCFIAGGLQPDTVQTVVTQAQPFGIDVAGGIETDGSPDIQRMQTFIENARNTKGAVQ